MSDMAESHSDIDQRAAELVLYELSGQPRSHRHFAQHILSPRADAVQAATHERVAQLYEELIAAAPGIWNGRDEGRIAAAEAYIKENGRG